MQPAISSSLACAQTLHVLTQPGPHSFFAHAPHHFFPPAHSFQQLSPSSLALVTTCSLVCAASAFAQVGLHDNGRGADQRLPHGSALMAGVGCVRHGMVEDAGLVVSMQAR